MKERKFDRLNLPSGTRSLPRESMTSSFICSKKRKCNKNSKRSTELQRGERIEAGESLSFGKDFPRSKKTTWSTNPCLTNT